MHNHYDDERMYPQYIAERGGAASTGGALAVLFCWLIFMVWLWRKNKALAVGTWLGVWVLFSMANYIPLTSGAKKATPEQVAAHSKILKDYCVARKLEC
jgi:hypothetical protein